MRRKNERGERERNEGKQSKKVTEQDRKKDEERVNDSPYEPLGGVREHCTVPVVFFTS